MAKIWATEAEVTVTEAEVTVTEEAEAIIKEWLLNLAIPANLKGYTYLVDAMCIVANDPDYQLTKTVYPGIAKKHNTTASRVERAMRHAIEVGFDRLDPGQLERFFGSAVNPKKGKPTNSEFIGIFSVRLMSYIKYGRSPFESH